MDHEKDQRRNEKIPRKKLQWKHDNPDLRYAAKEF